jgi:putative ABC transport system substrate-binding protein
MRQSTADDTKKHELFRLIFCALLLAVSFSAEAQQPSNPPKIGFIAFGSPSSYVPRIDAFRGGLRELGYVDGNNIKINY